MCIEISTDLETPCIHAMCDIGNGVFFSSGHSLFFGIAFSMISEIVVQQVQQALLDGKIDLCPRMEKEMYRRVAQEMNVHR